jgi:hypothetical protein
MIAYSPRKLNSDKLWTPDVGRMAEIGDGRGSPIRTRASSHLKATHQCVEKYDASVEGR